MEEEPVTESKEGDVEKEEDEKKPFDSQKDVSGVIYDLFYIIDYMIVMNNIVDKWSRKGI